MPDPFAPYPDSIPPEALQMVWDAWRGNDLDRDEIIHAAWHVVGFALGKALPHDYRADKPLDACDPDEVAAAFELAVGAAQSQPTEGTPAARPAAKLERMKLAAPVHDEAALAAVPWGLVLQVALEVLSRFLKR